MSDKMTPISFGAIINWVLEEQSNSNSVFGIEKAYHGDNLRRLPLFFESIETPFGPAAGPHTQLAQNIIAAYYAGARFFELKTVQVIDGEELSKNVPKPCILADDEGYNCEWSTELKVEEALDEYIKAWLALKLLSKEFALGSPQGFVFNMSVGYDYEGITSPKIDNFIEGLKNAQNQPCFKECIEWSLQNIGLFKNINRDFIKSISPNICSSITLSTLHGCPPGEIERIADYLITVKKLHTFIKCNPTILGYETARNILDKLGYDYISFDEHHFKEDLQYSDAITMFEKLQNKAKDNNLDFGLKLSNTFPVDVKNNELPANEMYMSGKSLYPLTIEMASRFTKTFKGKMRISFSGGVDAYNIAGLINAGIWPVTLATSVLKPGGCERFYQLAKALEEKTIQPFKGVNPDMVNSLATKAIADFRHTKPIKPIPSKKTEDILPITDCFTPPCKVGCPIEQDIPEYISLVGQKRYLEALRVITHKNPLPFITGQICPHHCGDKCLRGYYEDNIHIRDVKLKAVREGYESLIGEKHTPVMVSSCRVAIIGGGPAGLSAAYFLGRSGVPVTLYEKRDSLGGIVRHVIPDFRIQDFGINRDIQLVMKMGGKYFLNTPAPTIKQLKNLGYNYIIIAVGAYAPGKLQLTKGEAINVLNFLERVKNGSLTDGKENICIVGAGNSAMDAARAAKRLKGVKNVSIVYRRTKKYMPADEEELALCIEEGIEFLELLAPLSLENEKLLCKKMRLAEPDSTGRRTPIETEETLEIPCNMLIAAVGEKTEAAIFNENGLRLNEKGQPVVNATTLQTDDPDVYVIGDARRGPSTVVEAIADASLVAKHILQEQDNYDFPPETLKPPQYYRCNKGLLQDYTKASKEIDRCLGCSVSCEICAQVCPNRANIAIHVDGMEKRQILHIDRMCNECGNCAVFCPYTSAPYLNKLTLFHTKEDFENSENPGFLPMGEDRYIVRLNNRVMDIDFAKNENDLPRDIEAFIQSVSKGYKYLMRL